MKLGVDLSVIEMLGQKLYESDQAIIFVKECIQNALDAGATIIEIVARNEGDRSFFSVSDNGMGISDFQSHFATIGGSYKPNAGSIGGFGIAKLAIMSMRDWKVTSVPGSLTMDILRDDLPLGEERTEIGTIVEGYTKNRSYNPERDLKRYLELCNVDCEIYLNDFSVEKLQMTEVIVGGEMTALEHSRDNSYTVRLNGLVMFQHDYYICNVKDSKGYVFDIVTDLSPYDDGYPMTATREAIDGNSEYNALFSEWKSRISEMRNSEVKMEILMQKMLSYSPKSDIYYIGNLSEQDIKNHKTLYKKWVRIIKCILETINVDDGEFRFGLSNTNDAIASYIPDNKVFLVDVRAEGENRYQFLLTAVHEVAHVKVQDHYDSFNEEYQRILALVLMAIDAREFKF